MVGFNKKIAVTIAVIVVLCAACLGYWITKPGIPVYMYHCVAERTFGNDEGLFVAPNDFELQLKYLQEKKYETIFAEQIGRFHGYKKCAVITFDDGYSDNYTDAFPILKKYGLKATIFVVAERIGQNGYLSASQIKEMCDSGLISIQSHTNTHKNLKKLNETELSDEFEKAKVNIQEVTGKPVTALAYPYGFYTKKVMNAAKKSYQFAFVTFGAKTYDRWHAMEIHRAGVFRHTSIEEFKTTTYERTRSKAQNLLAQIMQ